MDVYNIDANNVNLDQFERWYSQAGTPTVEVITEYNSLDNTYKLIFKQYTPTTPGQSQESKLPFVIPMEIGLFSSVTGKELISPMLLQITESEQTFIINDIKEKPVVSLLRSFSAPVRLKYAQQTDEDLALLMGYDTDSFNRWDAGSKLSSKLILKIATTTSLDDIQNIQLPDYYIKAVQAIVESAHVI
jgi:aminopeptidase N